MNSGTRLPCLSTLLLLAGLAACDSRHTPSGQVQHPLSSDPTTLARPGNDLAANAPTRDARLRRAPACSYLSIAEVSDILDGPIGKPLEKESDAVSSCGYPPLDMTSYQQVQIDIEWQAAARSTLEDTLADTFGHSAEGSQVAHRVRLGDSSSYSREGIMRIHAGGALISITLMMRPDSEQKAVALGQLLLERMGLDSAAAEPAPRDSEVATGIILGEQCAELDAQSKAAFGRYALDEKNAIVPLKVGLTLAHTWTNKDADLEDHECLDQVVSVTDDHVDVTESCGYANGKRSHTQRRICRQDLRHSHVYHPAIWEHAPAVISPTTLISLSTDALDELKNNGSTRHRLLQLYPNPTRAQAVKFDVDATLAVEGAAPKTYAILVNDKLVQLPVITSTSKKHTPDEDEEDSSPLVKQLQAAVLSERPPGDDPHGTDVNAIVATILDDARFPLMLDYQIPAKNYRIQYTKITYESELDMETKLAANEPVNVYGIYFDFASDQLRPESTPVLDEIAAILVKNPDWKLSVTGHTDGIGGSASNLDLSKRRAAEVKRALVEHYQVSASRLSTAGAGASAPQDTNETPQGRARNRRVVLRREY